MQLPEAPTYYTSDFTKLKGADFSVDSSLVDKHHSPDLKNIISADGAFPRKRKGWEYLNRGTGDEVYNIWTFKLYDVSRCVVAIGTKIIEYDLTTNKYVGSGITVSAGKKAAFFFQMSENSKGLYILTGNGYVFASATSATAALTFSTPDFYVPLVIISRDPVKGGGTALDNVNLLTRARKDRFYDPNGTAKTFLCTSAISSLTKVEYFNGTEWVTDSTATFSGSTVTISAAHAYNGESGKGSDNIQITYVATGNTSLAKIAGCTAVGHYMQGASDQVFISGNPNYPQYVYYCGLSDPTYFPDLNYLLVGTGGTDIMGFLNISGYLVIVKESSPQYIATYLITTEDKPVTDSTTGNVTYETKYIMQQGTTGIGAVSKWCMRALNDEPLFFSESGICGITSTYIAYDKTIKNRSKYIDRRLLAEPNLENAVAEVFNGYYILCVNGHAYVLDGRQKTDYQNSYVYESYYWSNVPAKCLCVIDNHLYFGTASGDICRFKNHAESETSYIYDYSDGSTGEYGASGYIEGEPIEAIWSTPNYDDGAPQYFKSLMKKGSMITLQPYKKSGVSVYFSIDSENDLYVGSVNVDIWSGFNDIDFSRFAFDTREGVRDYFFKKKVKRYKRLKIIAKNNVVNEPFGVHEIIRTYTKTRFAK